MKHSEKRRAEPWATRRCVNVTLTAFLAATFLSSMSPARAACPPYTPDPSLLENIENMEQLAARLPGASPLTPEQKEQLEALAHEKSPDRVGKLAKLEAFWRFFRAAPLPNPSSGPVPLTVEIVWPSYPISSPAKIEFDVDGDGKPEWIEETYQPATPRQYVYRQQGTYEFTVRIHDRGGQVHVYRSFIRVFSPAAFDAELQARWSGLKEALRQGDIGAALECVHTHSRARYHEVFQALKDTFPRQVDEILATIRVVKHRRGEAVYESVPADKGLAKSFEVRFGIDVDGLWRISSF